MDFGVGIATSGDSWKLAQRAEELGFTHAWFYDTQMLTGDCFVAMGAAQPQRQMKCIPPFTWMVWPVM
jgi:5,10-methylenetetrahydromethanopterin reductase